MPRLAALLTACALLAACGSGDDDSSSSTVTDPPPVTDESTTTTTAPPTTPAPTTAPPTTPVPTTAPPTTAAPPTSDPPAPVPLPDVATVESTVGLGSGWVTGASRLGPVAWISAPPLDREVLGCEGLPADELWAQPLDGGDRIPALPEDPDLVGVTDVVPGPTGRVVVVRACEGFFTDAWLAVDGGDGVLTDVTTLPLPSTTLVGTIRWTPSGDLTYVDRERLDEGDGALVELQIDGSGPTELVVGDVVDGALLAGGQLIYQSSTETLVDGFALGTFAAPGPFAATLSVDDRNENAIISADRTISVYLGADDELVPLLDEVVVVDAWHPSGQAVLVHCEFQCDDPTPRIVRLDGTVDALRLENRVAAGAFSSDGRRVIVTTVDPTHADAAFTVQLLTFAP